MTFDLEKFKNSAVDPLATQFEVVPEGEFPFILDNKPEMLEPKELSGTSQRTGKDYHFWQLELDCICQDPAVAAKLGRDKVVVRMRLNLDLNDDGGLATGPNKNVALGQLRAALDQNKPGWSPAQLLGAGPFMGKVVHTKSDNGAVFADIRRVAPIKK